MINLKELKERIEKADSWNYEEYYSEMRNAVIDYQNETQTWEFEEMFESVIDYEIAEEQAKYELEQGGLVRLYYFLGNANCNNDIFKIDGYGNLEDITKEDLDIIKEEILEKIEELESEATF